MKKKIAIFAAAVLLCQPYSASAEENSVRTPEEWMQYLESVDGNWEDYGAGGIEDHMEWLPSVRESVSDDSNSDTIKVMIDPGHAGYYYNPSTVVKGYYESVMNWKLSNYLKEELELLGVQADLTKTSITDDPELQPRGRMSAGYDFFISIHSNASDYTSIDYPVAICYQDVAWTTIDDTSREIGQLLTDKVTEVMGTKQKGIIWQRLSVEDRDGNGVWDDEWYGVLCGARYVGTPGVLLEHSFHTNYRATMWLMQDSNLQTMAKEEAAVIAEYFTKKKAEEAAAAATITTTIGSGMGDSTETTVEPRESGTNLISTETTTTTTTITNLVSDEERVRGDVDGNGVISVEDAVEILMMYAQQTVNINSLQAYEICLLAADYDGDGTVRVEDAVAALECYAQQAAGLHPTLVLAKGETE